MLNGRSRLVFVIGGSNGLNDSVLHRADFRLSFFKADVFAPDFSDHAA